MLLYKCFIMGHMVSSEQSSRVCVAGLCCALWHWWNTNPWQKRQILVNLFSWVEIIWCWWPSSEGPANHPALKHGSFLSGSLQPLCILLIFLGLKLKTNLNLYLPSVVVQTVFISPCCYRALSFFVGLLPLMWKQSISVRERTVLSFHRTFESSPIWLSWRCAAALGLSACCSL